MPEFKRGVLEVLRQPLEDKDQASLLRFGDANTSYHYNVEVGNQEFHVRAVKDFMR